MVFAVYQVNPTAIYAIYDNFAAASKHKTALVADGKNQKNIEVYGLNVKSEWKAIKV